MAKVLSALRIARARRTSTQNVEETQEIDFSLGLKQGIEIFAVEFGYRQIIPVPGNDAIVTFQVHQSLHAETGGLEGAIDAFPADDFILNSEIIAETTLQVSAFTSSVPATSPDVFNMTHLQPLAWNFIELTGAPLLLAINPTYRVITNLSTLTVNGSQVTIFYRYVELTVSELASQFSLRR